VNRPSRLGVLGRHKLVGTRWFEFEPGYVFHTINAWEEVNEKGQVIISALGCRSKSIDFNTAEVADKQPCAFYETNDFPKPHLYRMNLTTGEKSEKVLSPIACEFPVIHPGHVGRSTNQFTWCATLATDRDTLFDGVVKFDMTQIRSSDPTLKEVGRFYFGSKRFGGEAVFVPRKNASSEDDGFLMTFVFDENTDSSDFVVYDAKTMSSEPLVKVPLPQRIPYGFHGIFVEEEKLQTQKLNSK